MAKKKKDMIGQTFVPGGEPLEYGEAPMATPPSMHFTKKQLLVFRIIEKEGPMSLADINHAADSTPCKAQVAYLIDSDFVERVSSGRGIFHYQVKGTKA